MTTRRLQRGDLLAIAIGGTTGAVVRWAASRATTSADGGWFVYAPDATGLAPAVGGIPMTTLVVNLAGCLLLGGLSLLLAQPGTNRRHRTLIGLSTGFCGSFTTFSSFAVETAELLGARVDHGTRGLALGYTALSVGGGALAFILGRRLVMQATR